jgi:hypothetical protein
MICDLATGSGEFPPAILRHVSYLGIRLQEKIQEFV